jgi:lysozyme
MLLPISVARKRKSGVKINIKIKPKYGGKMKISEEGKALIKKFEGCELEAYRCPAGVWTIGYGHTKGVQQGDVWSQANADEMLDIELEEYEGYINDLVNVELKQHQFDALVAWVYNLGVGNLISSTLLVKLNAGLYEDVPHEIKRWNKANGEILEGLVRRRLAESLLWSNKDWSEV